MNIIVDNKSGRLKSMFNGTIPGLKVVLVGVAIPIENNNNKIYCERVINLSSHPISPYLGFSKCVIICHSALIRSK